MKYTPLVFATLLCSCSAIIHPDINQSKTLVESLIQKENSGDYAGTSQLYTDGFNKSEPIESRTTKFKEMHDALGDLKSVECLKAVDSTDLNDFPSVYLKYRVKHSKLNSIEEFTVIKEEGSLKVEEHSVVKEQ